MRVPLLYILLTLVVVTTSEDPVSTTLSSVKKNETTNETININEDEGEELEKESTESEEEIPILPPIILLDFADDSENSTSDEKSKRTINNELGYGYLKNNLFNGKYNYYFPGGKSGTTVSIEESISPFEPKTIIEPYKPITERPESSSSTYRPDSDQADQPIAQPWTSTFPGHQSVFGQRTKLRKVPNDFAYQSFTSTPSSNIVYTTQRPDVNDHSSFTAKSNYQNQYKTFSTTASYNSRFVGGLNRPEAVFEPVTSPRPLSADPTAFNLPRYTIENGVRYEHKIVWKYPDGRIANAPATSYVNSYTEFNTPLKTKINRPNSGYSNSLTHQSLPDVTYPTEHFRGQNTGYHNLNLYQGGQQQSTRYQTDAISNIHSQRPAQFPNDPDSFSSRPGGNSQSQAFDLSYQKNYGLRQRGSVKSPVRHGHIRPISKYAIDSSNPEYTDSPLSATTPSSNLFTQSGQLSQQVLQKYTPQVQKYLSKVFTNPKTGEQYKYNGNSESFIRNNYENILNYHPSISQYIRDPSSILNAQPTFIQAGDSLVPVIILRVDGTRPVQQQPTPNINLKALLQQYLAQYTGSKIASATSEYDYRGDGQENKHNPLNELSQLTQVLRRFSSNSDNNSPTGLNNHRLADLPLEYESPRYSQKTSYDTVEQRSTGQLNAETSRLNNNNNNNNYNKSRKTQKIKSVQIIDDPRFPNYKTSR